jgi:hypothetical protein
MEYLQGALERIIPDGQQIAEDEIRKILFAPSLFTSVSLDNSNCLLIGPDKARRVAFLAEAAAGRRTKIEWMDLEAGRPSAVLANFIGQIVYIPASAFYYHDYEKLRTGIVSAARGFARRANVELLRLLCQTGKRSDEATNDPSEVNQRLLADLRRDGYEPRVLITPFDCVLPPAGSIVLRLAKLSRVIAVDTHRVGYFGGGPLRLLLGAHAERNAYWVIAGCYMNAVVIDPAATCWARVQ